MAEKKLKIPLAWRNKRNASTVVVNWRIALAYLAVAVVSTWATTVVGVYTYVKYRIGYTEVRIVHIAGLPFSLESYRADKGKFWNKSGILAAEGNLWADAFGMIQQGLPHDPENMEARMLLARIYLMAGRQDMAANVLIEGLVYNSNKEEYLHMVLSLLFSQQADDAIAELTGRLIAGAQVSGGAMETATGARLYALFNRDRFDEIDKLLNSGDAGWMEKEFVKARMAWELGNRETATSIMRGWRPAEMQEVEIYRTYSYYLKELGRNDERRRLAISRLINFPRESEAYLDLISVALDENNPEAFASKVSEYLSVFKADADTLVRLARFAGSEGLPDVAWKTVALCPKGSVQARDTAVLALEAELAAKNYAQADIRAVNVLAADPDFPAWQRQIVQGLQGVAWLGLGKTTDGQGVLFRVLDGGPLPPAAFASLAKQIRRVGDTTLAARFYRRALAIDASQGGALVDLLELELEAGTLEQSLDLVEKLPDVRKPSPVFMRRLIEQLESDRYLYVPARVGAIDKLQRRLVQMRAVSKF